MFLQSLHHEMMQLASVPFSDIKQRWSWHFEHSEHPTKIDGDSHVVFGELTVYR